MKPQTRFTLSDDKHYIIESRTKRIIPRPAILIDYDMDRNPKYFDAGDVTDLLLAYKSDIANHGKRILLINELSIMNQLNAINATSMKPISDAAAACLAANAEKHPILPYTYVVRMTPENFRQINELLESTKQLQIISTDTEEHCIHLNDVDELAYAMDFKSKHIKAHAEPELFEAIRNNLKLLSQIKHIVTDSNKMDTVESRYSKIHQLLTIGE